MKILVPFSLYRTRLGLGFVALLLPQLGSAGPPVGLGAWVESRGQERGLGVILEGHHHFLQRREVFDVRQYGVGTSRLELGTPGVGIHLSAISGISLHGIGDRKGISLFVGIEPFSGMARWRAGGGREEFYEWLPSASAGLQGAVGKCRLLAIVRGGSGVGNFAEQGLWPSFHPGTGAGVHFNCAKVSLALSHSRVHFGDGRANFEIADLSGAISRGWEIGIRAERTRADGSLKPGGLFERILLVSLRGDFLLL